MNQALTSQSPWSVFTTASRRLKAILGLGLLLFAVASAPRAEALKVKVDHHYPCNLFETGKTVTFTVDVISETRGPITLHWRVTDYLETEVATGKRQLEGNGKRHSAHVSFEDLVRGYYELQLTASQGSTKTGEKQVKTRFGVADFFDRSAEEGLQMGIRFGMRHRNRHFEGLDACIKLGMQWERNLYIHPERRSSDGTRKWSWKRELEQYRRHAVDREIILIKKVELFPASCYDADRYGPMEDYEDPVGKHPWTKRTVPLEHCYKEWIRDLTSRLPASQKIFEVWNEPWGKYPPQDYADILKWTVQAIKDVRPDARVGPDTGNIGYDIELARHGAFKNVDLITIHPYVPHPEKSGIRTKIRRYRKFMREHIGRELPLYTTEWGFGTQLGPRRQAAYMVRQALAMYAEDIKALVPFIMTPSRRQWKKNARHYGYVSYHYEPYPAFLAYANCARMIDASRFVGDLWLGPYIGALLFERDDIYTLALWTDGESRTAEIDPRVDTLTKVDIMGREQELKTNGRPLTLTLNDDPIYLVGVNPDLETAAAPLDEIDRRWPHEEKQVVRHVPRAENPPSVDGKKGEDEWDNALKINLVHSRLPAADASAVAHVSWDQNNLYLLLDVTDDHVYNPKSGIGVYKGDSLELYVSSKPEMRIPETRGQYDYQVVISPTSESGEPVNYFPGFGSVPSRHLEGERMAFVETDRGWRAEMALPLANFPGFPTEPGKKAAFEILVNDLDKDNPTGGRDKLRSEDALGSKWHRDAVPWGLLVLEE